MAKKLTKEQLEKKMKFHEARVRYYDKKIKAIETKEHRIGFINYD